MTPCMYLFRSASLLALQQAGRQNEELRRQVILAFVVLCIIYMYMYILSVSIHLHHITVKVEGLCLCIHGAIHPTLVHVHVCRVWPYGKCVGRYCT